MYGLERRHLLFFMDIGSREVRCGGIAHNPDNNWTTQIARNMCDMWDGFLLGKRYLIHDRDPVFNKRFDMIFESIGIEIKKTAVIYTDDELPDGKLYPGNQNRVPGQNHIYH